MWLLLAVVLFDIVLISLSILNPSLLILPSLAVLVFFFRTSRIPSVVPLDPKQYVSVIIPMRNEEKNIIASLDSLAALTYPSYEVLLVDDDSTDETCNLAEAWLRDHSQHAHIQLLQAPSKPLGWVGKTFAADYAITHSSGDIIVISDTDVRHTPKSLTTTVATFQTKKADILTRVPFIETCTLGEQPFLLLVFILKFSSWCSHVLGSNQTFGMGTYLVFSRTFYIESGGWKTHREFPESLPLINYARAHDKRFFFLDDDSREIYTRMYVGGYEAARGMIRNIHFKLLQPLPFGIAFYVLSLISLSGYKALKALLDYSFTSDTYILSFCMLFFGLYLFLTGNTLRTSVISSVLLLFYTWYLGIIALLAGIRHLLPVSVNWRGRMLPLQ